MSDEKDDAYAARVKANVEEQADTFGELARGLKVDEVMATTRESLLESALQLMTETTDVFRQLTEHYMTHYVDSHPTGPADIAAVMMLAESLQRLQGGMVVIARWNALHPDQKPVGNGNFMAHVDKVAKGGGQ